MSANKPWSEAEEKRLIELHAAELDYATIASMMPGRTPGACESRIGQLIDLGRTGPTGGRPWSPDEDRQLLALVAEGRTFFMVAQEIGRTERSVANRIGRLRNRGKRTDRSERTAKSQRLTRIASDTLAEILRRRGWTCEPPVEVSYSGVMML